MPVAMTKAGVKYYLAYDQTGTLKAVANASGNVLLKREYDSFGNILNEENSLPFAVPFGFAGGLHDRDMGLVRFGYRDYDPETGRWTAKDPIGFAGGDTDLYGYCLNDPVNWIDPWGLEYAESFASAGAVVGAGIAVGVSVVADAATGGLNILASPSEIAAGAVLGGVIGYGVGTVVDWLLGPSQMAAPGNQADTQIVSEYGEYASGKRLNCEEPKNRCDWLEENKGRFSNAAYKATAKAWGCKHSRVGKDKKR